MMSETETTLLHCSRITKLAAVAQPPVVVVVVVVLELALEQQPSRHVPQCGITLVWSKNASNHGLQLLKLVRMCRTDHLDIDTCWSRLIHFGLSIFNTPSFRFPIIRLRSTRCWLWSRGSWSRSSRGSRGGWRWSWRCYLRRGPESGNVR